MGVRGSQKRLVLRLFSKQNQMLPSLLKPRLNQSVASALFSPSFWFNSCKGILSVNFQLPSGSLNESECFWISKVNSFVGGLDSSRWDVWAFSDWFMNAL